MGSRKRKAAAVNLLVHINSQRRDTLSKKTATASTIQITTTAPILMLALELGEEHWKIGFSSAFGQVPLVRDIGSRDTGVLLAHIEWAKKKLGLPKSARVVSCYEAGREGFWLHPFLAAEPA
jgi:transposase